jgi:hypothetical protein
MNTPTIDEIQKAIDDLRLIQHEFNDEIGRLKYAPFADINDLELLRIHITTLATTLAALTVKPIITQYDRLMSEMTVEKMAELQIYYDAKYRYYASAHIVGTFSIKSEIIAAEIEYLKSEVPTCD